ncbi:MAG: hypothetical protein WD048_00330 [Chitinophagales bacterium]
MLSFFDNNKPFLILPLFLLVLILHLRLFFDGISLAHTDVQAPIAQSLVRVFDLSSGMPVWLVFIISSVLHFLAALVFNQFFNDFKFIDRQSHLPAYMYILVSCYFTDFLQLHPMLFANILCLLSLNQLFLAYNAKQAFKAIYNGGFLIALAALFYFPFLMLIPVLIIGLFVFRGFIWREWTILVLGILTPFYLLLAYFYLSGQFVSRFGMQLSPKVKTLGQMFEQMNWLDFTQSAILIIISIFALFVIQSNYFNSQIKIRKYFTVFYWLLAFCVIAALVEFPPDLKQFMILTLPLSFAFSYLIMSLENKRWANLLNIILLLIIFSGQYFGIIFN